MLRQQAQHVHRQSLAVLGPQAKPGDLSKAAVTPLTHPCALPLACPDRDRGPQPRSGLGQARYRLHGWVAVLLPPAAPRGAAYQHVNDVPGSTYAAAHV